MDPIGSINFSGKSGHPDFQTPHIRSCEGSGAKPMWARMFGVVVFLEVGKDEKKGVEKKMHP